MLNFFRKFSAAHARLKHKIHNTKIPLSLKGQRMMGLIYFSVPVISGYFIMQYTQRIAESNFQKQEHLIRNAAGKDADKYTAAQNEQLKEFLAKQNA